MRPSLPPFAALRAFEAVGRGGGIRRGADLLGLSHAIVSRHVAALEEDFGQLLLDRSNGSLTEAGRTYHARLSAAMSALQEATDTIRGNTGTQLTIACSAGFSLHWLAGRLAEFSGSKDGCGISVDLRSTDEQPNFLNDGIDGAIRYWLDDASNQHPRGLRHQELARPLVVAVASPSFLQKWFDPLSIDQVLKMPLIQEGPINEWRFWLGAHGVPSRDVPPPAARFGQAHLALAAARAGQGLVLCNALIAGDDLSAGRLKPLPGYSGVALGAYIFTCPAHRWSQPSIQKLRRWLVRSLTKSSE